MLIGITPVQNLALDLGADRNILNSLGVVLQAYAVLLVEVVGSPAVTTIFNALPRGRNQTQSHYVWKSQKNSGVYFSTVSRRYDLGTASDGAFGGEYGVTAGHLLA
jgi:hypothetical protein